MRRYLCQMYTEIKRKGVKVSAQDRKVHMLFQSKGLTNFCPGKDGTEIACYVRNDEEAVILR